MKKFEQICCALITVFIMFAVVFAEAKTDDNRVNYLEDLAIIKEYFSTVNDKKYKDSFRFLANEFRNESIELSEQMQNLGCGIYSIKSIDVDNIEILADLTCAEINNISDSARKNNGNLSRIKAYLVKCKMSVCDTLQDGTFNEFFFNGLNYYVITIGLQNGNRRIADCRLPLPDTVLQHETLSKASCYLQQRFPGGVGIQLSPVHESNLKLETCAHGSQMPSSIKIYTRTHGNGSIVTSNFKEYCMYVAAAEIGYTGRDSDFYRACVIPIRNYGWYRYLNPRASGYHVYDDSSDQNYDPSNKKYSDYLGIVSGVNYTWEIMMFTYSGRLFKSEYRNAEQSQYSGRLSHIGANNRANQGWSYKQILHYYYDESAGTPVLICDNHNLTNTTIVLNNQYHDRYCSTCACYITESHNWVTVGNNKVCSFCGHSIPISKSK